MMLNLRKIIWIGLLIGLLAIGFQAQAQTAEPTTNAPQFLYRNGDKLILVNGETGEAQALPGITAGEKDRFEWSAGGQYVAVKTPAPDKDYSPYCLNIYNVDEQKMLYDKPLSCDVGAEGFSHDGTYVVYSTRVGDDFNSVLWLYKLSNGVTRRIYETTNGQPPLSQAGIDEIQWSPTDKYVSFVSYRWIMGGTINGLYLFNAKTLAAYPVPTPIDPYYASYRPIWSADDAWILLNLKERYVTSGALPRTNDEGDIYLVQADTGEIHRLTFTPTEYEGSLQWTDDGQISYTLYRTTTLTLDEALSIQAPPYESIIQPEPVDAQEWQGSNCKRPQLKPPTPDIVVEICPPMFDTTATTDALVIEVDGQPIYGASLPESYEAYKIVIGWRPQQPK